MADPAIRRMTVDEFLTWDSGDEYHYELIDGHPVVVHPTMMSPSGGPHQTLIGNLAGLLHAALKPKAGCVLRIDAGIVPRERSDTYFEVDLGVTCSTDDAKRPFVSSPILLVEVPSPSTEAQDRKVKLPSFRRIASVQEVLLIDSTRVCAELHRRLDADRWLTDLLLDPQAILRLDSVGLAVPLAEAYDGAVFPD